MKKIDLYKMLTHDLFERRYIVSYDSYGVKIKIPGQTRAAMLKIKEDIFELHEYIKSDNCIIINGNHQLVLRRTTISNIHEPDSFEKVYEALDTRIDQGHVSERSELEGLGLLPPGN